MTFRELAKKWREWAEQCRAKWSGHENCNGRCAKDWDGCAIELDRLCDEMDVEIYAIDKFGGPIGDSIRTHILGVKEQV